MTLAKSTTTNKQLDYTSERVNPEWYRGSRAEYLIYLFHLASYHFPQKYTFGKCVLDYGCGTGYGAAMLADSASQVVGIDIVADVIAHAQSNYRTTGLSFQLVEPAESGHLPFPDEAFDTVVSFQVIEHVRDVDTYLSEICRVMKPGGHFVSATPDRTTRLFPAQQPWNMHHVTEFSGPQLVDALQPHFESVDLLGMQGDSEVLAIELNRARRMKWMSLPVTLPFVSERVRQFGLRMAKRTREVVCRRRNSTRGDFGFDETAIRIGPHTSGCVNLIAVARK